jgi:hypothetical protein
MVYMSKQLFDSPKNLFQNRVQEIIKENPVKNLISDLIQLTMLKACEKGEKQLVLVELYNLLGTQKFMDLLDLCDGKTIKFPTKESFKESVQTALCYYYKEYKGMSWDDIKIKLQDEELQTTKVGLKIHSLQRFIDDFAEMTNSRFNSKRLKKEDGRE